MDENHSHRSDLSPKKTKIANFAYLMPTMLLLRIVKETGCISCFAGSSEACKRVFGIVAGG